MGKPKKGTKAKAQADSDDDVSGKIASLNLEDGDDVTNGEVEDIPKPSKQKKQPKKKPVVKKQESEEDEESDEEEDVPAIRGRVTAMSAFQMLADDGDSLSESDASEKEEASEKAGNKKKEETKEPAEEAKQQKGKGKKKEKKKDEDIDAILADLDKPAEKAEKGKKKKKGKDALADLPPPPAVEESRGFDLKDVTSMTQDEIAAALDAMDDDDEYDKKKKKKDKKKGKQTTEEPKEEKEAAPEDDNEDDEDEGAGTVRSAAQKKKDKKERQKLQKQQEKVKAKKKGKGKQDEEAEAEVTKKPDDAEVITEAAGDAAEGEKEDESDKKKKQKKKGKVEEEEKKKKPSKMAKAILELQQKQREEEERIRLEEEERERKAEEAMRLKEEQERIEKERKEREKQKRKDRVERKKAEGTYLTAKQKEDRRRAQEMLELMKAKGLNVPAADGTDGKRPKRITYDNRKKKKPQHQQEGSTEPGQEVKVDETPPETPVDEEEKSLKEPEEEVKVEEVKDSWEDEEEIKDSWDVESDHETEDKTEEKPAKTAKVAEPVKKDAVQKVAQKKKDEESDDEEESSEEESESEEESSDDSSDDDISSKERRIEKTKNKLWKRKEANEAKRSIENLRAPVVCVLGHVDTGKTKILDNLRRTNVQDGEAGGITQQIGATNVPANTISDRTKMCKEFAKKELKLPGLLIIDTPGHESFSNLRSRGSSLCDIAILVVDIMHGLEPQTIESINLLKQRKCPFIVALNKIDRLYDWKTNPHNDVVNTLKKQEINTKQQFDELLQSVIVQFAEQGLNACLAHENKNMKEYISLVPTSAHSGDGMGNLMALVCDLCQTMLAKRIAFSDELQATVMEVKAISGLGTTIDVILVNGHIKEGDTIVVAGQEGPIVTQIRGLLTPQPLRELRVKANYIHHKAITAAQGIKISAKDLEKALAGLPLYIATNDDETEVYKAEIESQLKAVLGSIKLQERGVFVQASTLGSLEALLEFLRTSKIPYAGINIGPVHKKDIMKASIMLEHDKQYAVILAFDVKVEREAQDIADNLGVRIFTAEIIYHLFDQFMKFREDLKKEKQDEFRNIAVFPCKLRVLPQYIFNSRDPIVMGVIVEAGFVKEGTPICVPSKEFTELGRVTSVESNHKIIEKATKGMEVCIKIEPIPGDAPKMYGRHFDDADPLVSKISRDSIDAVKNYFRDEMSKTDWQLVMELKKVFEIL